MTSLDLHNPALLPAPAAPTARRTPAHWLSLRRLRTQRWTATHGVAALVMGTLGILATLDVWREIHGLAIKEPEYQHIFLVPIVLAWMIWVRRSRIRHCKPTGMMLGVVIAAVGWGVSAFGFYNGYQSLRHGGAVMVVLGCVLSVLGKQALFRFFPAVAVLVFLVPVPHYYRLKLSLPLQTWTAQVSEVVLQMFGVPVERATNRLSIGGETIDIIHACNGLRNLFPLILVSYAFSFGLPLRNSVRIFVLLLSPITAIVCNVMRIIPNVLLIAYVSSQAGETFHTYSGIGMLPISFLILLGIIKVLRWAMVPVMKYTLAA